MPNDGPFDVTPVLIDDEPKAPTRSPYDPVTIVDTDIVTEGPESSCEGCYDAK